jgi:hypothetical protein
MRRLIALALLVIAMASAPLAARAETFAHAMVVTRDGTPALVVDGKPFFFWGAAFFYERIPPERWQAALDALRALGFNTLDLYVPWNWHELSDGRFDFDGTTNPRRNLRALLALARADGFFFIVRPGPVIRNEWRNGGYPAWLLERPEYGMPLHDVLEGRYPATATLQNASADDAAAQWLANATHRRYARRWLTRALREFVPVADRVIAVALDDDQAAYIDNQTWPAPHLQRYLGWLESGVRAVVGPQLPVFINTYEMKVTASAPVWAMGNWYQSDAYAIGEHDRAALEFSTGLLQTQPRWPVAISEFQAGWLAPPEDPTPRPAAPENTALALHTMLDFGAHGVVDFPPLDTVNPDGWEAPFANASYAWDAALDTQLRPSPRWQPTADFGALVGAYGAQLAGAHRVADGAIAYLTSAYPPSRIVQRDVFRVLAATQAAQHACRTARLTCDLVDLRYGGDTALARYPFLVVPQPGVHVPFERTISERLARYAAHHPIYARVPTNVQPVAGGLADATVFANALDAFLDVVNYTQTPRDVVAATIRIPGRAPYHMRPFHVGARATAFVPLDGSAPFAVHPVPPAVPPAAVACELPTPAGIGRREVLQMTTPGGGYAVASVALDAGARIVGYRVRTARAGACSSNAFTSVGGLRDDVFEQNPPSPTDRIAKYTNTFPAGMFNRPYRAATPAGANPLTLTYDAPDVVPHGAHFARTIALDARGRLTLELSATFPNSAIQRLVDISSFPATGEAVIDERPHGDVRFRLPDGKHVVSVRWEPAGVAEVLLVTERTSTVLRIVGSGDGPIRLTVAVEDEAPPLGTKDG